MLPEQRAEPAGAGPPMSASLQPAGSVADLRGGGSRVARGRTAGRVDGQHAVVVGRAGCEAGVAAACGVGCGRHHRRQVLREAGIRRPLDLEGCSPAAALFVQARSISLVEAAVAVRPEGAAGRGRQDDGDGGLDGLARRIGGEDRQVARAGGRRDACTTSYGELQRLAGDPGRGDERLVAVGFDREGQLAERPVRVVEDRGQVERRIGRALRHVDRRGREDGRGVVDGHKADGVGDHDPIGIVREADGQTAALDGEGPQAGPVLAVGREVAGGNLLIDGHGGQGRAGVGDAISRVVGPVSAGGPGGEDLIFARGQVRNRSRWPCSRPSPPGSSARRRRRPTSRCSPASRCPSRRSPDRRCR